MRRCGGSAAGQAGELIVGPWSHSVGQRDLRGAPLRPRARRRPGPDRVCTAGSSTGGSARRRRGGEPAAPTPPSGSSSWARTAGARDAWPPADVEIQAWYLRGDGRANTVRGDGLLSPEPPTTESPDAFLYDPRDPVPTMGGATLNQSGTLGWNSGPWDQRPLEARPDVLVYTSPPLERPLTVIGPSRRSCSCRHRRLDTDFTAKLVDVHPNGRAEILADGILRARTGTRCEPAAAGARSRRGDPHQVGATANLFLAGHRVRLDVSSSNFPRFDANTNTGGTIADEPRTRPCPPSTASSTTRSRPSRLLLPVVRARLTDPAGGGEAMAERFLLGVHVMTYGATWPEVAAVRPGDRPPRLRLPAHARPPPRDAGRPLPAVLRVVHDPRRVGGADEAGPPGPPDRRQPVPQPGRRREGDRDARPHQQRPDDPVPRGRDPARGVPAPRTRGRPDPRRPAARARRIAVDRDAHLLDGEEVNFDSKNYHFERVKQRPRPLQAHVRSSSVRAARRSACASRRSTPTTGRCRSIRHAIDEYRHKAEVLDAALSRPRPRSGARSAGCPRARSSSARRARRRATAFAPTPRHFEWSRRVPREYMEASLGRVRLRRSSRASGRSARSASRRHHPPAAPAVRLRDDPTARDRGPGAEHGGLNAAASANRGGARHDLRESAHREMEGRRADVRRVADDAGPVDRRVRRALRLRRGDRRPAAQHDRDNDLAAIFTSIELRGVVPSTRVPLNDYVAIGRRSTSAPRWSSSRWSTTPTRPPGGRRVPVPAPRQPVGGCCAAAVRHGLAPQELEAAACVLMVETKDGLANVDEIAATPGVDCDLHRARRPRAGNGAAAGTTSRSASENESARRGRRAHPQGLRAPRCGARHPRGRRGDVVPVRRAGLPA